MLPRFQRKLLSAIFMPAVPTLSLALTEPVHAMLLLTVTVWAGSAVPFLT